MAALTHADWLLLTIASAKRPLEPVQLQKAIFLIGQNLKYEVGDSFYKFIPYNYGPFCQEIYADAQVLAAQGLVTISPGQKERRYAPTTDGESRAAELARAANVASVDYVKRVMAWMAELTFPQLLSAVYKQYPDWAKNSVFRFAQR